MIFDRDSFLARLREPEAAPAWPTGFALWMTLAYVILRIAALALVSVLGDPVALQTGVINPLTTNVAAGLAGLVTVGVVWSAAARRSGQPAARALRVTGWRGSILLLFLLSLGVAILNDYEPLLFQTIGLPPNLTRLNGASPAAWIAAGLVTLVIEPLVRAILFAGLLYPALAAGPGGNGRALPLTALVFTLVQVIDNPADPVLWLTSFLAGGYLIGVRAHQKSTGASLWAAVGLGLFTLFKTLRLFL